MASKARALIQTMWRKGDGIDNYFMIGGAVGAVTGVGVGVVEVLEGGRASTGVVAGMAIGGMTAMCWPLCVVGAVIYVPLKGLEFLRRP